MIKLREQLEKGEGRDVRTMRIYMDGLHVLMRNAVSGVDGGLDVGKGGRGCSRECVVTRSFGDLSPDGRDEESDAGLAHAFLGSCSGACLLSNDRKTSRGVCVCVCVS